VIVFDHVPVTCADGTVIASNNPEASSYIVTEPESSYTVSLNVSTRFAPMLTPVASSIGDTDVSVGAVASPPPRMVTFSQFTLYDVPLGTVILSVPPPQLIDPTIVVPAQKTIVSSPPAAVMFAARELLVPIVKVSSHSPRLTFPTVIFDHRLRISSPPYIVNAHVFELFPTVTASPASV